MSQRLFISYARADGLDAAATLRETLRARGLGAWQDLTDMEGGWSWWEQIRSAITEASHLVLVISPAALKSEVVRREWRLARQEGVCVVPVLGKAIDFDSLPYWMRREHFVDPRKAEQLERLVRTLTSPCVSHRAPLMLEELSDDYVPRQKLLEATIAGLVTGPQGEPTSATVALVGAGGFGKTTLAHAVCHDERVQNAFSDGILRVSLGPRPNLLGTVSDLVHVLTGTQTGIGSIETAVQRLAELVEQRAILLVIDDVWSSAHLKPLLRGTRGPRCARLVTTRDSDALPAGARIVAVETMTDGEALDLLEFGLPSSAELPAFVTRLGTWPLLIKLANAVLRDLVSISQQPLATAVQQLTAALMRSGPTAFDVDDSDEREAAVAKTVGLSLDRLSPELRERFVQLAIFPAGANVPLETVAKLWGATADETLLHARRLRALSLVSQLDLIAGTLRLHDGIRELLERQNADKLPGLHCAFLASFAVGKWAELDAREPYLWRQLEYHLVAAGCVDELLSLLADYTWLQAKLLHTDITALIGDYRSVSTSTPQSKIREALTLASSILFEDKGQLASQLAGRLTADDTGVIAELIESLPAKVSEPWLRPIAPTLISPGGPLIRTFAGVQSGISGIAVTRDDTKVVAASWQHCTVWDLKTGLMLGNWKLHDEQVDGLAATPSGTHVLSSGSERLKYWDLKTGEVLLDWRCGPRSPVAVSADGRFGVGVTRSGDKVKVVDLETGEKVRRLKGHRARIEQLMLAGDPAKLLSFSEDGALILWDFESGEPLLEGHAHRALGASVALDSAATVLVSRERDGLLIWDLRQRAVRMRISTPGFQIRSLYVDTAGQFVAAIGSERSVRVWDLADGSERRTLTPDQTMAHYWGNYFVLLAPKGILVSTVNERALGSWDLETGAPLAVFRGHSDRISTAICSSDGKHVITGGGDGAVKLWSLGASPGLDRGDHGYVHAIALGDDQARVASGASDGTIKVTDFTSGEDRTLVGHTALVCRLAVAAGENRIVSASYDGTVRFWTYGPTEQQSVVGYHGDRVLCLELSKDRTHAFSGAEDKEVKMWRVATGDEVARFTGHGDQINQIATSGDGTILVSASEDWTVGVWSVERRVLLHRLTHQGSVSHLAIDASSTLVVSGSAVSPYWTVMHLQAWRLSDAKMLWRTEPHARGISALVLTGDGRYVATSSEDGEIKLLDGRRGQQLKVVAAHRGRINRLLLLPGDRFLVSEAHDGWLRIWRVDDLSPVAAFAGEGKLVALASSCDGLTLAVGEASGLVHLLHFEGIPASAAHLVTRPSGGA